MSAGVVVGLVLGLVIVPALGAQGVEASAVDRATGPRAVLEPVTPWELAEDLRTLPELPGWSAGLPVFSSGQQHEIGRSHRAEAYQAPMPGLDPLLGRQGRATLGAVGDGLSGAVPAFAGLPFSGTNPPDTVGAVGPGHYIQMVNAVSPGTSGSVFAVYDKSGERLAGPVAFETLWPEGACRTEGRGDPIVLYDQLANRWLMSQLTSPFPCLFSPVPCHLCVAVSRTPNPIRGGWYLYDFAVPEFPDYPKYAVAPDAYLVGANSIGFVPVFSQHPGVYALDRRRMLGGRPAGVQTFAAPFLPNAGFIQSLLPADLDGHRLPPAGESSYFLRYRDGEIADGVPDLARDHLELWDLKISWARPEDSVLTGPTLVEIAELTPFSGLVPQPGAPFGLAPFSDPLMWRVSYRNFGSHETLLGSFTVDADGAGHAGVRWFELRRHAAGAWALHQEGTFAPDAAHRWMGSIAMDRDGNIALGYSISSPELGIYPSIRVTGRRAGDPLGTLSTEELTLAEGEGPSTETGLWGDYSAMTVDPADDCTFWYTNELVGPDQPFWSTAIGAFRFPGCHPAAVEGLGAPGASP